MPDNSRIVSPQSPESEAGYDKAVRPPDLASYLGQSEVKEQMKVFLKAAQQRKEALDHVLIHGPPGLGKTTLANIIANEMGGQLKSTSGPVLEKQGDLAALLTSLNPFDCLFIDEIHRLSANIEEILYPAMEDFELDILVGDGPAARSIKLSLPPFTLIGATTRAGALTSPLRARFGITQRLEYYKVSELLLILERAAALQRIPASKDGLSEIARRARGTPRIANRLLRRVRDFAEVKGDGEISQQVAAHALDVLGVDNIGFDQQDRRLLETIIKRFKGGPVGLDSVAAAIGEERMTIEDVLEPYLVQEGYLLRTPRGRVVSEKAIKHLGLADKFQPLDLS